MRKILVSLFLVSIMVFGFASVSSAANWQWITSTTDTTYSFDTTSLKDKSIKAPTPEHSQLIYSVWIKYEYTDAKMEELAAKLNFNKPIKYLLNEIEFDYKNKATKINAIHAYAKDGTYIDSVPSYRLGSSFKSIIPDSVGEVIYYTTLKNFIAQRTIYQKLDKLFKDKSNKKINALEKE